jgi:hypothetical protein
VLEHLDRQDPVEALVELERVGVRRENTHVRQAE